MIGNSKSGYTAAVGTVNENGQENLGRTDMPGTDYGYWMYKMRCGLCGNEYFSNASDIPKKKCPRCQEKRG